MADNSNSDSLPPRRGTSVKRGLGLDLNAESIPAKYYIRRSVKYSNPKVSPLLVGGVNQTTLNSPTPQEENISSTSQDGSLTTEEIGLRFDEDLEEFYDSLERCNYYDDFMDNSIDESLQDGSNYFNVMSVNQIYEYMDECIKEVNQLLQLPKVYVRVLLSHFSWNQEKLLEAYFADENPEQIFKSAHMQCPSRDTSPSVASLNGNDETCEICYLEKPSNEIYAMECGHCFCHDCWLQYLNTKIKEDGVPTISCAGRDCLALIDDVTVEKLVVDKKVIGRYKNLLVNYFVQTSPFVKWCPGLNCDKTIRVQSLKTWKPISCTCEHRFCFQCGENWHGPVYCDLLKKWRGRSSSDSMTSNWISKFTKNCPKCDAIIQKNGGCNQINCKSCGISFCWLCLKEYGILGIISHKCNLYDTAGEKTQEKEFKLDNKYYMFCYDRYMSNLASLEYENKLHKKIQNLSLGKMDMQLLKNAVTTLCQCRQTLAYSFVFAFFLKKTNESLIFGNNQRDLQNATEALSKLLEGPISSYESTDFMQKVQKRVVYCEKRLKGLENHVYEGYKENWWIYVI